MNTISKLYDTVSSPLASTYDTDQRDVGGVGP